MTGTERLNWSATCWASLKLRGMTRWTWTSESAVADRAQGAGARGRDRLVVGEDVVDLVAAGAAGGRQAAHRSRSRSRRASKTSSELVSGSNVVLVLGAVVVILGQAEVDQRSMPGVA